MPGSNAERGVLTDDVNFGMKNLIDLRVMGTVIYNLFSSSLLGMKCY